MSDHDERKCEENPGRHGGTELRRWRESSANGDEVQARMASLFAGLPAAVDTSPERLARMRRRLNAAVLRPASRGRRWVWAMAGGVLLLGASGVGLAEVGWRPAWMPWIALLAHRPRPSTPPADHAVRRLARQRDLVPAPVSAGAPLPHPVPVAASGPSPHVAPRAETRRPAVRAEAGAVEAPPAAASEAASLETALVHLRRERDAVGALRALDDHDARFPAGDLSGEAARLRVDALLLVGRNEEALRLLEHLPLSTGGRDLELRVIRGELLAAGGRCSQALADFDRVPAAAAAALLRRAAAGRQVCTSPLSAPNLLTP